MKKFVAVLMAVMLCFLTASVQAFEKMTVYYNDGSEKIIARKDSEKYKSLGWYDSREDVIRTIYSPDGREATVFLSQLEAHEKDGWSEDINDVTTVMYSADGFESLVFLDEVDSFKDKGLYENKSDVIRTVYRADGTEKEIFLAEVETHKNDGWYENKSDVIRTVYRADGTENTVYLAEVESYRAQGWYENKEDVQRTLCKLYSDEEITVYLSELDLYKGQGWYEKQSSIIDPSKPMLALTFDDGPSRLTTPIILDALEKFNAKATFFVLGSLSKNNSELLVRMLSLGCSIGNHSYRHPDMKKLSDEKIESEISSTDENVLNGAGVVPALFRPPYGSYNSRVSEKVNKPFILWSVDTLDWKYRDTEYVKNYILDNAYDGAIILLHDIHETSVNAAKAAIPELIGMGYQLVTVEELAYYKGYTMNGGSAYYSFR